MKPKTEYILGYAVDRRGLDPCVDEIVGWIRGGGYCRALACLNPHSCVMARSDERFSEALRSVDWLVPDGAGVVLASKILLGGIRERVTGSDIFATVNQRLNELGGYRVFFLGSTEQTLAAIRERMAKDYPNVEVVGTYSPPFTPNYRPKELEKMIAVINAAAPHVLWVGMTAPKQEKWILDNRHRLDVPFAAAIGAVFDFYTGRVTRSHPLFQKVGLEWLPRLFQQPRRLWRRTFISAPIFMGDVFRQRARR